MFVVVVVVVFFVVVFSDGSISLRVAEVGECFFAVQSARFSNQFEWGLEKEPLILQKSPMSFCRGALGAWLLFYGVIFREPI